MTTDRTPDYGAPGYQPIRWINAEPPTDGVPSALGADAEDHTRKIFEKWSKQS